MTAQPDQHASKKGTAGTPRSVWAAAINRAVTVLVGCGLGFALIVVALVGDIHPKSSDFSPTWTHGWPWPFLLRETRLGSVEGPQLVDDTGPRWMHRLAWSVSGGQQKFFSAPRLAASLLVIVLPLSAFVYVPLRGRGLFPRRFSLRSAFLMTSLFAILLGYWQVQKRAASRDMAIVEQLPAEFSTYQVNLAPEWLQRLLGRRLLAPFDRIVQVEVKRLPKGLNLGHWSSQLSSLSRLREIRLRSGPLSADVIAVLKNCKHLESLWLTDFAATSDELRALSGLHLKRVVFIAWRPDIDALRALCELTELEDLWFIWSSLPKSGWAELRSLPRLKVLRILSDTLSKDEVAALPELLHVESLEFFVSNIDDGGIDPISRMPSLERVWLTVSDSALARLRAARPDLEINPLYYIDQTP